MTDLTQSRRHPDGIIIALDGPAGSGKSSTARAVAREMGYRHLDSGAFYRAITFAALREGIPAERWSSLTHDELDRLDVHGAPRGDAYALSVAGREVTREIRSPEVNAHVSRMAAVPAVREWLMDALREAGARGGLVADGRDIGTVVFPDAELKVYLVADPRERARRRLAEHGVANPSDDELLAEAALLGGRDEVDAGRAVAPLARAADAVQLDTTGLEFAAQVAEIVQLARARGG